MSNFNPLYHGSGLIKEIKSHFKCAFNDSKKAMICIDGSNINNIAGLLLKESLTANKVIGVHFFNSESPDSQEILEKVHDFYKESKIIPINIDLDNITSAVNDALYTHNYRLNYREKINLKDRTKAMLLQTYAQMTNSIIVDTLTLTDIAVSSYTPNGYNNLGIYAPFRNYTKSEMKRIASCANTEFPLDLLSYNTEKDNFIKNEEFEELFFNEEDVDRYIREATCKDDKTRDQIIEYNKINKFDYENRYLYLTGKDNTTPTDFRNITIFNDLPNPTKIKM